MVFIGSCEHIGEFYRVIGKTGSLIIEFKLA